MNRPPRGAKRDGKGTSRRKKSRPVGNGHTNLIRQLWEAAVNLRGSIEPADYKRFVLPIVFLRFLSLRYERRRHELERLVKEPGSEYYTKNVKQAAAILVVVCGLRLGGGKGCQSSIRGSTIDTLAVLEGRLSPRVLGLVTEWAALHREELREDWRLARQQAPLRTIAPLE